MVVGINGANGFIGYHLWVHIKYLCDDLSVIKLSKDLSEVDKCDVIVHLAEKNKGYSDELYKNNINSTKSLITSLEGKTNKTIIYSSSLHEDDDDIFGLYRRENKQAFKEWATRNIGCKFTSLRIPNVYGPMCIPYYNSFVATFCSMLITDDKEPTVTNDSVKLVYVYNLCKQIIDIIRKGAIKESFEITHDINCTVSLLYAKLVRFKEEYIDNGTIPLLEDIDDLNLFNTFRSYIPNKNRLVYLEPHTDDRGTLAEIVKTSHQGQSFYSTTKQGYIRGQHFHVRKLERFCVLKGQAKISMRKIGTDEVIQYSVTEDKPAYIDMPLYYTHNITPDEGCDEIVTLFWVNELFVKDDTDTYWVDV